MTNKRIARFGTWRRAGGATHCLLPTACLLAALAASGCDAFKATTSVSGSSSTGANGNTATGGGTAASPAPTPNPQTATVSLSTPPGSLNAQSPFFNFSTRNTGASGEFRFIQPTGTAPLQITTVGASNGGRVFDLGAIDIDANAGLPASGDATVQVVGNHVYGVTLLNSADSYGRILVTAQSGGSVSFAYRYPVAR